MTVLNISNLLIFVENIGSHYCNIYAHQSKNTLVLFYFNSNVTSNFNLFYRCIEPATRKNDEPQAGASGYMMRKVLLG